MSEERLPEYPDIPTLKEKGYDVIWGSLRAIAAPKGVDPMVIKKLELAAEKTANNEKWQTWLEKNGGGWAFANGADTQKYVLELKKKVFTQLDELVAKGVIKK
jgi:tripartite-type tricarboxylate transporter receptor subunit TctC